MPAAGYFVHGFSRTADGQDLLHVVDPEKPSEILLSTPYTASAPVVVATTAYSFDGNSKAFGESGAPMVAFVKDRQIFRIMLTKPGTPTAVRVSARTDVCQAAQIAQVDETGLDAWLWVELAGADGDCDSPADNGRALVRTGTKSEAAVSLLPTGSALLGGLSDRDGRLLWILTNERDTTGAYKLVAYRPDLVSVDVVGGANLASVGLVSIGAGNMGPVLAEGVFVRADSQLRRLSGDAIGLSLAAPAYTFSSPASGVGTQDGGTLYFPDANKLVKVQGTEAASVLATLPPGNGRILAYAQTQTHIVAQQVEGTAITVTAISKADGNTRQLLAGDALTAIRNPAGLHGDTLYYTTASGSQLGDLRRIQIDGSGDAPVAQGLYTSGGVTRVTRATDHTLLFHGSPSALLYCIPVTGAADCRGGSLQQLDLASETVTVLGSFSGSSAASWSHLAMARHPAAVIVSVSGKSTAAQAVEDRRDLWLALPGRVGSLQRVTHTLP